MRKMAEKTMTIYDKIYEKAKPYLDTRRNEIHVSISYDFVQRLLSFYPQADEDIVLPAILLHDVGWKMVPEERQKGAFGPDVSDNETQRFHEIEGARIAGEIMSSLNYPEHKVQKIMEIIDGHDTRIEALSLNDMLVKDADKLWRYTPTGVDIDHARFGIDRSIHTDLIGGLIDKWFFTSEARKMAREALYKVKTGPEESGS
jgi:hypothetical protein